MKSVEISQELMDRFINRDGIKQFSLHFPDLNLDITNEQIYSDTLSIKESLSNSSTLEMVGCVSSTMSVELHGVTAELKGQRVSAYMTMDGSQEVIPLFNGYVDSVKTRLSDCWKQIQCYDFLYSQASDLDISEWYKSLTFPITLKEFRNRLFGHIGIWEEDLKLCNDDLIIDKIYDPKQMNALDVIKNICQINGTYGIINRHNLFDYRGLTGSERQEGTYPSTATFPDLKLFPYAGAEGRSIGDDSVVVAWYRDMEYEDYTVYPIDKVIIRDTEDSEVVTTSGTGSNAYIMQGNIFCYGLDEVTLQRVADNLLDTVKGYSYQPFNSVSVGMPFVEVGTLVSFYIADYTHNTEGTMVKKSFYILNRELKGIQDLTDTYSAEGEQGQRTFVSDLNVKIDLVAKEEENTTEQELEEIREDIEELNDDVDEINENVDGIDERVKALEEGGGSKLNVKSVETMPSSMDKDTLYLVQGEMIDIQ